MRRLLNLALDLLLFLGLFLAPSAFPQTSPYVYLTGKLQASNGLSASNFTLTFQPTQWTFIAGSGVQVPSSSSCATSTDGTVVGVGNPLNAPQLSANYGSGSLPAGNYYAVIAFYQTVNATNYVTLVSPEAQFQLTATGSLIVAPPTTGVPANANGMQVYISATSGSETLQGTTTGSANFTQSTALSAGSAVPATNTTICQQTANDAMWPTGTGYNVAISDSNGNTLPGYPMVWQLLGPGTTINLSNGLPYYHGVVTYPVPILAQPLNHAGQSINGPLSLNGYSLQNAGAIGVGTTTPVYAFDARGTGTQGQINAKGGYVVNGNGGTAGYCLASDGTAYDTGQSCGPASGGSTLPTLTLAGAAGTGATGSVAAVSPFSAGYVSVSITTGTSTGTGEVFELSWPSTGSFTYAPVCTENSTSSTNPVSGAISWWETQYTGSQAHFFFGVSSALLQSQSFSFGVRCW